MRLAAVFTLLVVVVNAQAQPAPDPEYQGMKGSQWVDILKTSESPRQRVLAVTALGKLWTDSKPKYQPGLEPIGRAIRVDPSPAVRIKAINVVAGFAPEDVNKFLADDLTQALESEKDAKVRRELAVTVGVFPAVAGKGTRSLARYLKDPDAGTRAAAATALGRAGPTAKDAVPELLPLLKDTDPTVRRAAAFALGRISVEDAAAAAELAKLLDVEKDPAVRRETVVALGLLADRSGRVVQAVAGVLTDADIETRRAAIRTLARFGPAASPVADAILKAARTDKDREVRVAAVRAFAAALGPNLKGRAKDLYPSLDDTELEVRVTTIEALGALGNDLKDDTETLAALRKRLSDPQAKAREAAAQAIKRIESPPPPEKKQ